MHDEQGTTTSRRGSSPPQEAGEIYSDWLKRPRSIGTAPGADLPENQELPKQEQPTALQPL